MAYQLLGLIVVTLAICYGGDAIMRLHARNA